MILFQANKPFLTRVLMNPLTKLVVGILICNAIYKLYDKKNKEKKISFGACQILSFVFCILFALLLVWLFAL